ncbi:hypothetical protein HDU76_013063 [Blyttiomyces sp. JEL0837]|nr:hypothetical protein HDU76_013063 [Blyttiomyces sp. JEL0837]
MNSKLITAAALVGTIAAFVQPATAWGKNTTTYPPPTTPVPCWTYAGCYKDLVDNVRAIPDRAGPNNETIEGCISACASSAGSAYTVIGVENFSECFCGTTLPTTPKLPDETCNFTCAGNAKEPCGGDAALGVYIYKCPATSTSTTTQVSTTPSTSVSSSTTYLTTETTNGSTYIETVTSVYVPTETSTVVYTDSATSKNGSVLYNAGERVSASSAAILAIAAVAGVAVVAL